MDDAPQVRALLTEIRDLQRQHLDEYRQQAARSLALAEESVARQRAHVRLYRRVIVASAVVIVAMLLLLFSYAARR